MENIKLHNQWVLANVIELTRVSVKGGLDHHGKVDASVLSHIREKATEILNTRYSVTQEEPSND